MRFTSAFAVAVLTGASTSLTACADQRAGATAPDAPDATASVTVPQTMSSTVPAEAGAAVLLVVDDDAITHGAEPTFFTELDVNADSARKDHRGVLPYFAAHVGRALELKSAA